MKRFDLSPPRPRAAQAPRWMLPRMRRISGFSLIELMITVAVVAILASVAYPSYREHVVRSLRSEAQQFMLQVANRQEEYFLNTRMYADDLTLGKMGIVVPERVARVYQFAVAPDNQATPPNYKITMTPILGTSQELDGKLILDQRGNKTPKQKW